MDSALKQALDFANYQNTLSIHQKTLKEKIDAKLTYAAAGGIFKIDQTLMVFVQMLLDRGRISGVPLIDVNSTPVLIDNLEDFRDEIVDRYFSTTLEYYHEHQKIKQQRSVEKLLDL